jgi:hypothetical protein
VEPEVALQAVLALLVVGSALALGSVHRTVLLGVGVLSALAFALALRVGLARGCPRRTFLPAVMLMGLAGISAIQLVPLPIDWLAAMAPANADVWSRALLPFGEPAPAWVPISLDPGATWTEVLRWYCYAAAASGAAVLAYDRGVRWGLSLVFVASLAIAAVTVAHGLVGATRVFGWYEPSFAAQHWHVGPLLNPNNLSGYLNLGAFCGLGLVLSDRTEGPRWALAVGVAAIIAANVSTASRGGLAVLLIGLVALAGIVEISRWRGRSTGTAARARWMLGGAVVFGLLLALLGGTDQVWDELVEENVEKLQMLTWIRGMVSEFAWVGTGRGAFEGVSPAFQPGLGSVAFTHAENFVAQWAVEWGIPVAAAALVAFGWLIRPRRLGVGRQVLCAAAWLGVVVVAVHNLVDLAFEVPAVMLALAVVVGSLWGRHQARVDRRRASSPKAQVHAWPRASWWVGGLGAAIGAGVVGLGGLSDLAADRKAVAAQVVADASPRTDERRVALWAALHEAMIRHPAAPYFPLVGAMLAWQEGDQNPMPWIQRALERSLVNGKTHLLLAQILMDVPAKNQALLELRLAVENDPTLTAAAARLALQWASSLDDVLRAVPTGQGRAASLATLGRFATDRELGAACDRLAIELDPDRVGPRSRLAADIIDGLGRADECLEEQECLERFEAHARAIARLEPDRSTAVRLRARLMAARGEPDQAEKLLAGECDRFDDRAACLRTRADVAAQIDEPGRLESAGKALLTAVCIDRARCAEAATWVGDLHARRA